MSFFAGQQPLVEISESLVSPSFVVLKALRSCWWQIVHDLRQKDVIADSNWVQLMPSVERRLQMECELYGASHTAQEYVRNAALHGSTLRARVTLANGIVMEMDVMVERYRENASEDELLEVELSLASSSAVSIT